MLKWLLKKMIPSAKSMSDLIAEHTAKAINESGKSDQIANYTKYAESWDKVQGKLIQWFADGKISEEEKAEFSRAIQPLVEKILEEIKNV